MKYIIVEDHLEILEMLRAHGRECYANAEEAHKALTQSTDIELVFLDINGIQKNGFNAESILILCAERKIRVVLISDDPLAVGSLMDKYGCRSGTKSDALHGREAV